MILKWFCVQFRQATESQDSTASLRNYIFINFINKISSNIVYSCPCSGTDELQWSIGHAVAV